MNVIRPLRRLIVLVPSLLLSATSVDAADWISLRTRNFIVIGDESAGELKSTALRLEQFSEIMAGLFPVLSSTRSTAPVVVVVFKDAKSFEPYLPRVYGKPLVVGAYLLGESDVNYLTMRSDGRKEDAQRAYYLFAGLTIRQFMRSAPPWFVEGVAEYLSSFEVDGTEAKIGRAIQPHVARLRNGVMPLSEVFNVRDEASYGQGDRLGLFHAKSWFLMHYAVLGKPERFTQLVRFAERVGRGQPVSRAFVDTFGFDVATLESELESYLQRRSLTYQTIPLRPRTPASVPEPVRVAEVDAQVWRADLLAHEAGRESEAETLLEAALQTAPEHVLAHTSLGLLLMRQKKTVAALPHLARAVAADVQNPFAHYYYAVALIARSQTTGATTAVDDRQMAMVPLKRAIELAPNFAAAKRDLGYLYLLGDEAQPARDTLATALADNPDDRQTAFLLARAELQLGHVDEARRLLGTVSAQTTDAALREAALRLLAESASRSPRADVGGIVGGVVGGLASAPPPPGPPSSNAPVRIGGNIKAPPKTHDVRPAYPAVAQAARVQGTVVLEATIGPDGKVTAARVLVSIPLLDASAIDAVRQWEFEPTVLAGVAVPVIMTVTVQFSLSESPRPETAQP